MMNRGADWNYRPLPQREPTDLIRRQAYRDSFPQKMGEDSWSTEYKVSYIEHPLEARRRNSLQPSGVQLGGGASSPNEEEMRSNYQNEYKKLPIERLKRAPAHPSSEIFEEFEPFPECSTAKAAMIEGSSGVSIYDNREMKSRAGEERRHHMYLRDPADSYQTTYKNDFQKKESIRPNPPDPKQFKSSIEFPRDAGVGPNTRRLKKKEKFPAIADAPRIDQFASNVEIGCGKSDYNTSYGTANKNIEGKNFEKPPLMKAPPCAVINTNLEKYDPWSTQYRNDYIERKPDPTIIDQNDLKAVHYKLGNDPAEWPTVSAGPPTQKIRRGRVNFQESNSVFRGDGLMNFETTTHEEIGNFKGKEKDESDERKNPGLLGREMQDGSPKKAANNRQTHLYFGSDYLPNSTEARDANRFAGTGKPAERIRRGDESPKFAHGGLWDPKVDDEPVKRWRRGSAPVPEKKRMQQTNFVLSPEREQNKGIYETTYFEEICRRTIF